MNPRPFPPDLAEQLRQATADFQDRHIIPHCTQCSQPCCKLETLVLDLSWKQVKVFWKIEESRAAFDQKLARGQGPQEIRESQGRYYIHSKPCPAYDLSRGQCQVYGQPLKPPGCSDFPVYEDGDRIMADLRCEALDLEALRASLAQTLGPDVRLSEASDPDFPFLVSLFIQSSNSRKTARSTGKGLPRVQRRPGKRA